MKYKTEWGSSTIGLAAAVMALGAEYNRTDKTDPRKMVFYFVIPDDKADMEKYFGNLKFDFESVERAWTNGTLMVNALRFSDALQRLKSVVHSR
jgi:hypothetical protein